MEKNNRIKKLADNPYYAMSDTELQELSDLLKAEAQAAAEEEKQEVPLHVNKNRVSKHKNVLKKTVGLQEQTDVA